MLVGPLGDILFGVEEADGVPVGLVGVPSAGLDGIILRLESSIRDGIQPRIAGILLRPIEISSTQSVLIARVPRSLSSPHMVTFGGSSRFFSRNTRGKYQLDVHELRAAFTATANTLDRIRAFRLERIARIVNGETPVLLDDRPKVLLHVVPISTFESIGAIDLDDVLALSPQPAPMNTRLQDYRHNLNGLLFFGWGASTAEAHTYLQVFRNGALEAVAASLINPDPKGNFIRSTRVESQLIEALGQHFELLTDLEIPPPYVVMVSFLGVEGYKIFPNTEDRTFDDYRLSLTEKNLILPDLIVDDSLTAPSKILKPLFDMLWNAAGWPSCLNYSETGDRIINRR
jgi:hypothetical protein